ncbi:DUF4075 domain-containing protein [Bacillus mycoides]|uniref:DUF4075 domain-containing protein n=1 Tax=Bacillus mycoides TaxID=1405 RepID=UPI003D65315E
MTKKNNITRNIMIGVAVGIVVSMFKKENREKVKNAAETAKSKVNEISENTKIKENIQIMTDKGRELADLNVVKEKVIEIKKLAPAVIENLKETIEIFCKKKVEPEEKMETQAIPQKEEGSEIYIELNQAKESKKSV